MTAKVAFARLELLLEGGILPFPALDELLRSIVPGTVITRYGRTWRMGPFVPDRDWILGRVGFQASEDTDLWSEDVQDFIDVSVQKGATSPFALYLPQLRIAFQLRSGQIRPTTFRGNFAALLRQASGSWDWRVELTVQHETWTEWRSHVSRVTEVHARLERPNPNYHGRHQIETMVEESRARLIDMIMRADSNDLRGLEVDALFLQEALAHAEDEYGFFRAEGEILTVQGPQETRWDSSVEGAPLEADVAANPETGEALFDELRAALSDRFITQSAQDDTGASARMPAEDR